MMEIIQYRAKLNILKHEKNQFVPFHIIDCHGNYKL